MANVHPSGCTISFGSASGNYSTISAAYTHATKVSLKQTADNSAFATSGTAGAKKRTLGVKDWSLSMDYKADGGVMAAYTKGSIYCMKLVLGDSADFFAGYCRVASNTINVDIETGETVGGSITFEASGALFQSASPDA